MSDIMKQILKFFLIYTFLITLVSGKGFAADPPFLKFMNDSWVDSLLENMTLEEKISQLMMITAYPQQNDASKNQVIQSIKELKPGGILVMQGNPVKTAS